MGAMRSVRVFPQLLLALMALGANAGALDLTILHINDHHSNHGTSKTEPLAHQMVVLSKNDSAKLSQRTPSSIVPCGSQNLLPHTPPTLGVRRTFAPPTDPIQLKISVADATTAAQTTTPIRVEVGGFTRMVTMTNDLQTAEQEAGRQVLKLHAGDAITGTSYYSLFRGESDAKMMAHMCFDAYALGNHEFDDGDKGLANFITMLGNYTNLCPAVAVLGANVVPGATSPLVGKIAKSTTITKGGEEIGVVGINIKTKTEQSSFPTDGTTLTEEAAAAQAEVDVLVAAGVTKIILLTHVGYAMDLAKLAALNHVDVVVGGDQHALLGTEADVSGVGNIAGAYPTEATNGSGKKVCVVQAWEYGKALGMLQVAFDTSGDVINCSGKPQFVYDDSSFLTDDKVALDAANVTAMKSYLGSLGNFHAKAANAATTASLAAFSGQIADLKATNIATTPADICLERVPGQGKSTLCNATVSAERGGGVAQLVAKAFMVRTPTADISIQNGGGCRVDIAAGDYSMNDAFTLLPFSNTIATVSMTGAQIVTLMEDAISMSHDGDSPSTGAYPYAAGLRFDVNASKAKGERVSNVEVNARLASSWSDIVPTQMYVVGTNNYIAGGKDGYLTFTDSTVAATYVDTYTEYAQIFVDYAKEVKTLIVPVASEFSTKSYVGMDGVSHTPAPAPVPAPVPVPVPAPTVTESSATLDTFPFAFIATLFAAIINTLC